ncbi:MAG TPA: hypothetical protein VNZ06_10025 [Steroidobacteraceae bacterium]|jgi:hypothetical protein|nr:hypothetical protein [Steroidobacteraceae bacterium]
MTVVLAEVLLLGGVPAGGVLGGADVAPLEGGTLLEFELAVSLLEPLQAASVVNAAMSAARLQSKRME